jgi:hypothetical protein
LETGVATDYIATTSAAVSVGPVSGLPRLDYTNSTCPKLLLEPQRTNVTLYSEQFDNAAWSKISSSVTANTTISPDGYTNADTIAFTAAADARCERAIGGAYESQSHTVSVYAKVASGTSTFRLKCTHASVVDYLSSDFTATTEWQRFIFTATFDATVGTGLVYGVMNGTDAVAKNVIFYGFQAEQNAAYATSYIPTLGTSVTRVEDAASKTGISSLIGQTEGTIYLEADIQKYNESGFYIAISDGAALGNAIYIIQPSSGNLQLLVRKTGNADGAITVLSANWIAGFNKVAIAYTSTTAEIFINGVSKGTTSFVATPAFSQFTIGSRPDLVGNLVGTGGYNQALLFKTRLTNDQMAELTSL